MRPDASENSQISPSTIVRAARAAGSHPTARQSCCKVGKTQIFTPVRESSGESQLMGDLSAIAHGGTVMDRESRHRRCLIRISQLETSMHDSKTWILHIYNSARAAALS